MSKKNSTSDRRLDIAEPNTITYDWRGLARRLRFVLAGLIVIHIGARLLYAYYAPFHFNFDSPYGPSDPFMQSLMVLQLHFASLGIITIAVVVPYLTFLGVRWLVNGK